MWVECSCVVVWAFFGIAFLRDWNENWPFQSCGHCWIFQICWHIECGTFTASSSRIWNSSTGIPSPPLALFVGMLPKAHLSSHSRMSGSRWVVTPSSLSGSWRSVLCSSSVYSCHLFLISFASVRPLPFLSFIVPVFAWNVPLVWLVLEVISSLSHSVVFLYFFALVTEEGFLISPCYFFGTLHSNAYILPFFLCLSLFFSQLFVRPPQTAIIFLHFFSMGMVLIPVSCTMSWTSFHSASGTLSVRSRTLNLFLTSTV